MTRVHDSYESRSPIGYCRNTDKHYNGSVDDGAATEIGFELWLRYLHFRYKVDSPSNWNASYSLVVYRRLLSEITAPSETLTLI